MRRFRIGLLVGFALGYWFGTKAGRERHRQLSDLLHRAKESEKVAAAADKAKDLVETGVEKGKGLVEQVRSDDGEDAPAPSGGTAGTGSADPTGTGTLVTDTGPAPRNGASGNESSVSRGKPAVGMPISGTEAVNPGLPTEES